MRVNERILTYRISEEAFLLLNTLTGAIDITTPQIYDALENFSAVQHLTLDEFTKERLRKRGYIFDSPDDETRWLQLIKDAHGKQEKTLDYIVSLTYNCNLRCAYCFEGDLTYTRRNYMDIDDVQHVFAAIDELSDGYSNHRKLIKLFGGEPLLPRNKQAIRRVLTEARQRSLPVSAVTNGTYANDYADLFDEFADVIVAAQVTLDGSKEIHDSRRKSHDGRGSFDDVCAAIEMFLAKNIKINVRTNLDMQNIGRLREHFDLLVTKGWMDNPDFGCSLSPVEDHSCSGTYEFYLPENLLVKEFYDQVKESPEMADAFRLGLFRNLKHIKSVVNTSRPVLPLLHYCEANNLEHIVFGPDGYIYPCTECLGRPDLAMGKFHPQLEMFDDVVKMWNGRNVLRMNKCRECDIALLCGGGCAYSALVVNGDINEPVCNNARETIFAYLDYIKADLADKASA
ncbi:MAG: radical SAM protein [Candidatus Aquicultor sp.]|nr:radical SAM protein [Candidatus Aquicultor sp.]